MNTHSDLTIVIPAKNEGEVIESVVRTVCNSDYPAVKMRVVLVDDGSTDNTWEGMQRAKADPLLSAKTTCARYSMFTWWTIPVSGGTTRKPSKAFWAHLSSA